MYKIPSTDLLSMEYFPQFYHRKKVLNSFLCIEDLLPFFCGEKSFTGFYRLKNFRDNLQNTSQRLPVDRGTSEALRNRPLVFDI